MCSHDYQPMRIARYEPGKRPMVMFVCSLCSAIEWREAEPLTPPAVTLTNVGWWPGWHTGEREPTPIPAVFLRAFEEE